MNKCCTLAAGVLLLVSTPTLAVELDPIFITATRTAQTASETLASVTTITRKDIERQQAQSVQDVLRGVPGVSISNNGGLGKNTSLFLRGTESDHVLVLIDGIKVGSATSGTTAFQDIPVEQIERIEIVRGPRSSLYGSEAIGGVIQIFTRKGGGASKPSFSIGAGSYGTYKATAGLSGGGERGWYNLNASGTDTEGFNACDGKPAPDAAGCRTIEPDKDGYTNLSGSLRAGYRFENGSEMDVHALQASSDNEFDASSYNESETLQQVLGGSLRFSPLEIWQLSLTAGRSRDEYEDFKDSVFKTRITTRRDSLSWQNDLTITDRHTFVFGLDYQEDTVGGTTAYAVTSRDNKGLFAQYQGNFGKQDLELSVRRDDNEQFDEHTTSGAAWAYALAEDLRLTISYGTAFKAPTFNELYWPGYGNPDLQPEESSSTELGLTGKIGSDRWSLHAYETNIDNLIAYDASIFAPSNISKVQIRGLETSLSTNLGGWDINTSLTLLNPENRANDANNGNLLPRRARQSFRFDADYQSDRYIIGLTLLAEGKRYDDLANTRELAGYGTVDLRTEYALAKAWQLQARIGNLLDKDYETASYYNQPGRNLFVTLRYQP